MNRIETNYSKLCEANAKLIRERDELLALKNSRTLAMAEYTEKALEIQYLKDLIEMLKETLEIYAMTNETFPEYGDAAKRALERANRLKKV